MGGLLGFGSAVYATYLKQARPGRPLSARMPRHAHAQRRMLYLSALSAEACTNTGTHTIRTRTRTPLPLGPLPHRPNLILFSPLHCPRLIPLHPPPLAFRGT